LGSVYRWNQALYIHAPKLKQLRDRLFDDVIRTGSAGGNSHRDLAGRQPILRPLLLVGVLVVMLDLIRGNHLGAVADKIGRQLGFTHLRQVARVAAVVPAHHDQQVHLVH